MKPSAMSKFLSDLNIFNTESAQDIISSILSAAHIERFTIYTTIMEEMGVSNNCWYIILSGSVSVFIEDQKVAVLGAGEIFWEYAPIFQRNRTATIIANTDITCLVLKKWVLLRLIGIGTGLNNIVLHRIKQNRKHNRGIFKTFPK